MAKKIAKPKKSVLQELDATEFTHPKRKTWLSRLPQSQQDELEEIRQAFREGRWKMTATQLAAWIMERYRFTSHDETIRRWLRSNP